MLIKDIDFLGKRKLAYIVSGLLVLISIISLATQGLQMGIDFTGGTLVEVGYKESADLSVIRNALGEGGFSDALVQHFGSTKDVLIRLKPQESLSSSELSNKVLEVINKKTSERAELRRVEFVGPQVGDELAEDGGLALLYAMFGILIYVAWRFEYKFSVGSVVALIHDVIITMGFFSLLGLEFDLTVLAAVLAVVGYSINDTIVVFDRIRDNFKMLRKEESITIINTSINETLSRTLMTSFTTIIVVVALAVLGGQTIHNFALTLLVGITVGTYSSIFIASAIVLSMGVTQEDLMEPVKEGVDIDNMP
ncbi:MAG: protein translocase subunit SecF [Methylicorpusculum sp.]|uniref:protein translocase subunit SecF n=1 Tax=Methylicorpusculum sp. TaxID=2713644 RepID=UPI0027240503|nr:protein translocase subunit SecF [Methylicorpusculum sp.]MDO8844693.1 protein translocase subunit SecF [Methylicorpusculum sp.]MDO8938427.1 protein translocase subunit SecF [Methylicorpusculum sp.]MDP2200973.1 protein translocase subunit SecF [Methylicorpusculum sp.]